MEYDGAEFLDWFKVLGSRAAEKVITRCIERRNIRRQWPRCDEGTANPESNESGFERRR
jgi:hypothetical protein